MHRKLDSQYAAYSQRDYFCGLKDVRKVCNVGREIKLTAKYNLRINGNWGMTKFISSFYFFMAMASVISGLRFSYVHV